MSRAEAGPGHNSELSDEDLSALHLHYTLGVRREQAAVAAAKAVLDEKRTQLNGTFKLISKDLRIKRKDFELDLQLADLSAGEFAKQEQERRWRLTNLGCELGQQMTLNLGDTVDDKKSAYQDGVKAGKRADDGVPPEKIATYLHPDWMGGWHDGQAENAPKLLRAQEIIDARAQKANEDEDDEDQVDLEELTGGDDEFDLAAAAKHLEQAGFTERDGDEDGDAAPDVSDVFPGEQSEAVEAKVAGRKRRQAASAVH